MKSEGAFFHQLLKGGRVGLATNTEIASLTLNTNTGLELAGYTLTLVRLTTVSKVYRGGIYTAAQLGEGVSDRVGGGRVVLSSGGMVFVIR